MQAILSSTTITSRFPANHSSTFSFSRLLLRQQTGKLDSCATNLERSLYH